MIGASDEDSIDFLMRLVEQLAKIGVTLRLGKAFTGDAEKAGIDIGQRDDVLIVAA